MPDIFSTLATLHGLGGDNLVGAPYGGEQPGGGINNLASLAVAPSAIGGDIAGAGNILATLNQPAMPAPAAPAAPQPAGPPAGTTPTAKHSIISVLGGLADAIATAGGAKAGYQPTLDAATARANAVTDRANAAEDRTRQINLDDLKLSLMKNQATTAAITADQGNAGKAIQAIQALQAKGGNAAQAWATYAKLGGVSPEMTAHVQGILDSDPDGSKGALDGLDKQFNGIEEYDTKPLLAYNAKTGEYQYVQAGKHGDTNNVQAPDGFTFVPEKVEKADLGDRVGNYVGGRLVSSTRKGVDPDTAATIAGQDRRQAAGDATRVQIQGMKPAGKGAAGQTGVAASTANAMSLLDNIERGFRSLHGQNALPGDQGGSVAGSVGNFIQRMVPGADAVAGNLGGQAAQTRLLMEKDINSLQSEMVKSLPASATRTKFEQEIQRRRLPDPARMSFATGTAAIRDLRSLYTQAQRDLAAEQARSTPGGNPAPRRTILPAPAGARRSSTPSISNW